MKWPAALLLLIAPVFCATLRAQTFQRTFGGSNGEIGTCLQKTPDGNFIISSFTNSFGSGLDDVYLVKADSLGAWMWSKTYGGAGDEICYYVSVCSDSGFILTGAISNTSANYDVMLIRTDKNGNLLWQKAIGGSSDDYGWYVLQADDGGFIVTGFTSSFSGSYDGYLVKTDAAGNVVWTKTFGDTGTDELYGISKAANGGYIVTGETTSNSFGNSDIWLIRLDSLGDTLWTKQYGRNTEDGGNAVIPTTDGGYAIAGDIHSFSTPGAHNAALLKTDSMGNLQWVNVYGSNPGAEVAYSLVQNNDRGFTLLCNSTVYGAGSKDVMLVRTDSLGNLKWANTYGDSLYEDCWYLQNMPDGGFAFVAESRSFGNGQGDIYLVRTDSTGNSACHFAAVVPGVRNPVMMVRSGITIAQGGNILTHSMSVSNPATLEFNPCSLQSVNEAVQENTVSVFPNPFHERTSLLVKGHRENELLFTLYDVCGRELRSFTIKDEQTALEREGLCGGMYLYTVSAKGTVMASGKLIVE